MEAKVVAESNAKSWANAGRWATAVLAAVGLLVSLYLTWIKVANEKAFCGGVGECESVNASRFSEIGGVPVALLGALAYAGILSLALVQTRGAFWAEWSPIGIFGLSLAGTIYSAYLTYIEIFVLRAICPYCVVSAVVITVIFILSTARLVRSEPS